MHLREEHGPYDGHHQEDAADHDETLREKHQSEDRTETNESNSKSNHVGTVTLECDDGVSAA